MKKYSKGIVATILVVSLISNIYLFVKVSIYKERQQQDYQSSVNHFYGHFWKMQYRLDQILAEKNKAEPDLISISANVYSLKQEIWQADEKLSYMEKYSPFEEDYELYAIPSDLFLMYFSYRLTYVESALSKRNEEELFQATEALHNEYSIVRDILPSLDTEFLELSRDEQLATWVEIVNELPESEELEMLKDLTSFDRLVKEAFGEELN
jgi:hypothetical protein